MRKPRVSRDDPSPALSPHQIAATAEPGRPLRDLVGNFAELDALFDQLAEPVVIELGKPLPKEKYLPGKRVGNCPAAHNRALLDERP